VRLVAVGDNVVDRYLDLGFGFPGGNAVNVAVAARRAGATAAYLGVVGTDDAAMQILDALRAEDVLIDRVRSTEGDNGFAEVEVVDGDRRFLREVPGVSVIKLNAGDLDYIATFDLAHTGECSFLEDRLAAMAARVSLSFDLSTRSDPSYLAAVLPHASIAFASRSTLSDDEAAQLAVELRRLGPATVIVTRGDAGSTGYDGQVLHHETTPSTPAVDTLGAGDAYIGTFLVARLEGSTIQHAMRRAAVAASAACAAYGAWGHGRQLVTTGHTDRDSAGERIFG
jgi:fructoselysine 6-kinase